MLAKRPIRYAYLENQICPYAPADGMYPLWERNWLISTEDLD